MIYIERTITINKNEATIEEPIVLYRGDKNIEIQFTINNNPFKYKVGTAITYGQLVIIRPNAAAIIPEPAKLSNGRVLFTIADGMIDENIELGAYDFQIRMINADQTSRGTLPPVTGGIVIKEPICEEATVGIAYVNSRSTIVMPDNNIMTLAIDDNGAIFDGNNDYIRTNWYGGDIITDTKLNKIEEALYQINDDIPTDYATEEYVDDAIRYTRDYIDDNFATTSYMDNELQRVERYSETYTDNAIGRINLDNYATVSYVDDQRRQTEAYAEVFTENAINKIDLSSYAKESFVTDSINSNNNYIETVVLRDYVTDEELEEAIANIEISGGGNVDLTGYATEQYVDDAVTAHAREVKSAGYAFQSYVDENFATTQYVGDALGKYATKSYVDKAVANIEGGGAGGINIMTIGNGIDEHIFTGDEFTYEEYTSNTGKSVLLDNVTINYVDAGSTKPRTITYKNELVYVNFNGDKLFTIVSSLSERENERSQYSIDKDGVITRVDYRQYATQEYVNEVLGDIETLLGGI